MTKQSETLTEFYRAYAAWLDIGAPKGKPFQRCWGLCTNLHEWLAGAESRDYNAYTEDYNAYTEMLEQFQEAGLDTRHPFNRTGDAYFKWSDKNTQHLNPKRIKWVRDHAA